MMRSNPTFVAVEKAHEDFKINFLGNLVWFSLSDLRINRDHLQLAFFEAGIDESLLPKPINPRDAFRRATKVAEIKESLDGDRTLNLLVREVKNESDKMIRHVVREIVDKQNVRLEYTPIVELILEGDTLKLQPLELLYDVERDIVRALYEEFNIAKDHYGYTHIRKVIMDILETTSPVSVRPSGGVYFVPLQYEPTLRSLQTLINRLRDYSVATTTRSRMDMIPVIDASERREMIEESLEDQVKKESESLIAEMSQLISGERKVSIKTAQGYVERVRKLGALITEYEQLLETQLSEAQSHREIAMRQAMALLEKTEMEAQSQ